jgi:hypothetical protein
MHRLIPVLAAQLGARIAEIPVEHHARRWGVSKYGVARFWRGVRDTVTLLLATRYPRFTRARLHATAFPTIALALSCGAGDYFTSAGITHILLSVGCVAGLCAGAVLFELSHLALRAAHLTIPLDTAPFIAEELRH